MSIVPDFLMHMGGVPVGMEILQPQEVRWVYHSATSQIAKRLKEKIDPTKLHAEIVTAETKVTAGQNEIVFMTPESHTLSAALTWDNSNTHIIGMHSGSPWSNSVKLTQSGATAQSPAITISGSDCLISNIHFEMAGSSANQHILVSNTGSGNHYNQCWFEGPTNATQADDTSVELVTVDGGGNYFNECVFGTTACDTNGAAKLGFTGQAYRSTFKDCIFYHQASGTSATFIDISATQDISGPQFFKNCIFVSWWNNQADRIAQALRSEVGLQSGAVIFDSNCIFVGCDAITTGGVLGVYSGHPLTAAHDGVYAGLIESVQGTEP